MKTLIPLFAVLFFVTQLNARESVVLAGGCFWCMEPPYDALKDKGIVKTTVGYAGGELVDPSYEQVSSGKTQHIEAIEVVYEPEKISLEEVYEVFWRNIDPYDEGGQFCDRGRHYRAAVFFSNQKQKKVYKQSKKKAFKSLGDSKDFKILELPAAKFYKAEDYHQDYYQKNPIRYKFYRYRCGRDERLKELWD